MCRAHKNILLIFFIFFLLLTQLFAFSISSDTEQPIKIIANSTQLNYKTGITIYEGNVKIDQGDTHLTADRLVTKNNSQHKLEEAIAYGTSHLAEYSTIPKQGDPVLHAKAKTIKFYPLKSNVILEGDVTVIQGENSFRGPMIIYNLKDQFVVAPPSKEGRATLFINPDSIKSKS